MQIPGLIPETLIQEKVFLKPFSSGSDAGGSGILLQQHGYRQLIKKIAALPMSVPSNDPRCALASQHWNSYVPYPNGWLCGPLLLLHWV